MDKDFTTFHSLLRALMDKCAPQAPALSLLLSANKASIALQRLMTLSSTTRSATPASFVPQAQASPLRTETHVPRPTTVHQGQGTSSFWAH